MGYLLSRPADHPLYMSWYRLPTDEAVSAADRRARQQAETGSSRLLEGYRRYFARGGRA